MSDDPSGRESVFEIRADGIRWLRKPTYAEWCAAQTTIAGSKAATQWTAGDWWLDGLSMFKEDGAVQGLDEEHGFDHRTILNYATLSRKFKGEDRLLTPHITYYQAVQTLPGDRAVKYLRDVLKDAELKGKRSILRAKVKDGTRKCPKCKQTMIRDDDEHPTLWVCTNPTCEHQIDYAPNGSAPAPVRFESTLAATVGCVQFPVDLTTALESMNGKRVRVSITLLEAA